MDLQDVVNANQHRFSETEREILAFMLENEEFVAESTINSLAHKTYTSTSSIIRLTTTRLRVSVADESLVSTSDADFKNAGALGLVRKGKAFQVIVGMDVPQVRERFETMVNEAKTLS